MLYFIRYFLFCIALVSSLLILTPFFLLRPFSPKNTHLFFRVFEQASKYILNIHVYIEGKEIIHQNRPAILIGNHQHNFDVTTVSKLYTNFIVILGKFELGMIPVFGQFYVLGGNILVKRGNRRKALSSMAKIEKRLKSKKLSVLIFPEGHRNKDKELLPFKKGAFHTAVNTGVPLLPFSVSQFVDHYSPIKGFQRVDIYIKIHQPIPVAGRTLRDIKELMGTSRKIIQDGITELNKNYQ